MPLLSRRQALVGLGAGLCPPAWGVASSHRSMEVLHWWSSASERLALDALLQRVNQDSALWRSTPVPGGSAAAAFTLLRSRLLSGTPPDWAQLSMRNVLELASKGALVDLGHGAEWAASLHPLVRRAVTVEGVLRAVPLGIYRINTLIYHRGLWRDFDLPSPRSWKDVYQAAAVLEREGVVPFVWSDDGSQLMTVFEILLLSVLGPPGFQRLSQPDGWEDVGVGQALDQLRGLRALCRRSAGRAVTWPQAGREFLLGRAGMWLTGDWARAELNAWGMRADIDYACAAVPGTATAFLYQVEGLAAFDRGPQNAPDVPLLARRLTEPALAHPFCRRRGALPARTAPTDVPADQAEALSLTAFHDPRIAKLPGLAHLLGMDGRRFELTAELLAAFVRDGRRSARETWQQLARLNRGGAS